MLLRFYSHSLLRWCAPSSILGILTVSVYLEVITLSGVTLSRLIAPIALLVVLFQIVRGEAFVRGGPQVLWIISLFDAGPRQRHVDRQHLLHTDRTCFTAIAFTYMLCFAALLDSEQSASTAHVRPCFLRSVVGLWSLASFKGLTFVPGGSLQSGRGQGGVGDPNSFASLQLIAFPLILVLAAEARKGWLRRGLGFTALVTIASVLATLSRGGLIALVLVAAVLPFLPAEALFASRRQKALVMLVLAVGVLVIFSRPSFRREVIGRAKTIFVGGGANGSERDRAERSSGGRPDIQSAIVPSAVSVSARSRPSPTTFCAAHRVST